MSEQVDCRCSQGRDALWSYCADDYFCPRCGVAVTKLISRNRFPPDSDGDEVWVYAQKGKDPENPIFVFPLAVKHSDQTRAVQRRKPSIDFEHSKAERSPYFESRLVPADSNSPEYDRIPNRPYRVQLVPRGKIELPIDGIRLEIPQLVGDFSANRLVLRVGNKPSIRIELTGSELESDKDAGNIVRLTHADVLDVNLRIHAVNAPVLVNKPLTDEDIHCSPETTDVQAITDSVSLHMSGILTGGTKIVPGTPWTTTAKLYAGAMAIPGQKVSISFNFDILVASIDQDQLSLTLERVEKGGVEFDPPNSYSIDTMYLGECRSNALNDRRENPEDPGRSGHQPVIRRLSIRNLGRERIILNSPTARCEDPFEWLNVRWATDVSEGTVAPRHEQLELEPFERGEIYVRVDLRNVSADQLPRNRSLSATIQARQVLTDQLFEIPLTILHVRERTPCPVPLCVDFGNTSSYASMKRLPDFPSLWPSRPEIVDVHELRVPESFHTVLFFKNATGDPFASDCEIGDLAILEAEKFGTNGAGALVSDLKRWIGDSDAFKTVTDPRGHNAPLGHTQRYRVADLIVLFLVRLIERAERILRKYSIQEICVSHPSKFDAARRQEFYALIDRVCEHVTAGRRGIALKRTTADVDEANAVAVGTVFEREIVGDFLQDLHREGRKEFVIACVDLGGGSLDTAIMKFEVVNQSVRAPRFRSEYLGIGGHSGFGGDNVTRAFMECLLERIHKFLEKYGLPAVECLKCVPKPLQKDSDPQSFARRNYQILWEIAEKVKLYQCQHNVHPATEPTDTALAELEPLSSFVQTRLVNDLILIPKVTGRIQVDPAVAAALKKMIDDRAFLVPLTEVYDHKIQFDLSNQAHESESLSVADRIETALKELDDLAKDHQATVDAIVLAGAGCRLPIVGELVRSTFQGARIVENPSRSKFRVAQGLVRFLDSSSGGHEFACSSHYSTFAYEVGRYDLGSKAMAIPNCVPLRQSDKWYPVRYRPDERANGVDCDVRIDEIVTHDGSRLVHVFRVEEDQARALHGWFDLTLPPHSVPDQSTTTLSDDDLFSQEVSVEIRLADSEVDMELRLSGPIGVYVWRLILATEVGR